MGSCVASNYRLPIRCHRADIEHLSPVEKIFAEYLIKQKTGHIELID